MRSWQHSGFKVSAAVRRGAADAAGREKPARCLISSGTAPLVRGRTDLGRIARAVAGSLPPNGRGRSLSCTVAPGLVAHADPGQARTILENLIGNAWKFTADAPRPRVTVGSRRDGAFFVRDNGRGFDPALAPSLFQPFFRLREAGHAAGTGLGLAIVARIVGRHGGRVWPESAPGKGATFYFTLPRPRAGVRRPPQEEGRSASGGSRSRPPAPR